MSTGTPQSDRKKEKKNKGEKKRKREKEHEEALAVEEHAPKKKKKQKASEDASAEVGGAVTSVKKTKKQKSTADVPESTPDIEPKKMKKKAHETKAHAVSSTLPSNGLTSKPPFTQVTESFYIALSPCANHFPLEGACAEHISPLLLTFYPPLKGVVLSYSNPRLSEYPEGFAETDAGRQKKVLGKSVDEYGVTFVWLTAEFLVFRPKKGTVLEGFVSLQNESILGLVCYNYFNAAIERHQLPKDWQWTGDDLASSNGHDHAEGEGHYVDGTGNKVEGKVIFRVRDFKADLSGGTISVVGTLLSQDDEQANVGEGAKEKKGKRKRTQT